MNFLCDLQLNQQFTMYTFGILAANNVGLSHFLTIIKAICRVLLVFWYYQIVRPICAVKVSVGLVSVYLLEFVSYQRGASMN